MATIDDILKKTNPVASRSGSELVDGRTSELGRPPLAYDPAVAAKQREAAGQQAVQPSAQPSAQPTLVERAYRGGSAYPPGSASAATSGENTPAMGGTNAAPGGAAKSILPMERKTPDEILSERIKAGNLTYSDMFDILHPQPSKEELERLQRQDKARRIIGAIGDGISAIANMYYVGKGAPSAQLVSLSDRYRKIYDDAVAKYKADADAWRKGKWEAYVQDILQGNKDREYDLDRTKAEDANRRAADKLEYNRNKDAEQARYRAERDKVDDAYRDAVLQERKANHAATLAQRKAEAEAKAGDKKGAGNITLYNTGTGETIPVNEDTYLYSLPQLVSVIEKDTGRTLDLGLKTGIGVAPQDKMKAFVNQYWTQSETAKRMIQDMSSKTGASGSEKKSNPPTAGYGLPFGMGTEPVYGTDFGFKN